MLLYHYPLMSYDYSSVTTSLSIENSVVKIKRETVSIVEVALSWGPKGKFKDEYFTLCE